MTTASIKPVLKCAGLLAGVSLIGLIAGEAQAQVYFDPYGRQPDLSMIRLFIIAAAGSAGFGLGWLSSPEGARARIVAALVVGGGLALTAVINNGAIGWGLTPFIAAGAFTAGFGYWTARFIKRLAEVPTTFGSAKWATPEYLDAHDIIGESGIRLGEVSDGELRYPIHYAGDRHLLTVAPNRSGKGVSMIIPNLLTYKGSVLVIDPKGENAMITAHRRVQLGQKLYVVDPWMITGITPSRFNPLDWVKAAGIDMSENAMILASAIVVALGKDDPFWMEEAKALIVGFILYVVIDEQEDGQRHLGRVRDLLMLDGDNLKRLFQRMANSTNAVVRSTGTRSLQKDEKLLSNVLASAQAQTHFLDSPHVRESLSASDFSFDELKAGPTSIYLVLPSDRLDTFGRWLRLLIQQAITVSARNIEAKPEKPVLFLLDEMAALGRLSMVEQAFGLMAGYGIQLHGVVQDLSQLKRIYGDGWETFISNAGAIQYFGSRDEMSASYFSKLCGVTTVWNWSTAISKAFGTSSGKDGVTSSETTTESDTRAASQRHLAHADELMRLHGDKQLVFIENLDPIIAYKTPWFEDEELKSLGNNLHAPKLPTVKPAPKAAVTHTPLLEDAFSWSARHD
ncbi:MAG TPA: type IV secretory system conjugative DNA transfer family protein [Pseudorhizobium sp.]|jgi:type IV secretion system protein VirD4|nr:type IV secretory system conjugative DNA transfer family protein [Pseudorhizobium sp.]